MTVERRMKAFGRDWTFNLEPDFDARYLWIGVFWRFPDAIQSRHFELSVCVVPMLPITCQVSWSKRSALA
jgi:hypothetical protein